MTEYGRNRAAGCREAFGRALPSTGASRVVPSVDDGASSAPSAGWYRRRLRRDGTDGTGGAVGAVRGPPGADERGYGHSALAAWHTAGSAVAG